MFKSQVAWESMTLIPIQVISLFNKKTVKGGRMEVSEKHCLLRCRPVEAPGPGFKEESWPAFPRAVPQVCTRRPSPLLAF